MLLIQSFLEVVVQLGKLAPCRAGAKYLPAKCHAFQEAQLLNPEAGRAHFNGPSHARSPPLILDSG